jgi:spectrin alpha
LRREFARQANDFHQWLADTRAEMMEASGSLEQQLDCIRRKATDIRSQRTKLKKIEDLGALLEEHLILDNRYTGMYNCIIALKLRRLIENLMVFLIVFHF